MKIHRISLSAESYARLAYISALEQISPKDWIEQRIADAWSLRDGKAKNPIIQLDDKPKRGSVPVVDIPQTRQKLGENPAAISRIKELWQLTPRPSYGKIALDVDYPKKTVEFRVKKLIESGELGPQK